MNIKPSYDLIIVIFACDTIEKFRLQILKIEDTWAKDVYSRPNIKLLFFLGEDKVLIKDNYIHLKGVKNDYLSASYKQWYGFKYAYENYDAKFVITAGTDTFFNIPKLMSILPHINHEHANIIGSINIMFDNYKPLNWVKVGGKKFHFLGGGEGIMLTRASFNKLYPIFCDVNKLMKDWFNSILRSTVGKPSCDIALTYFHLLYCNPKGLILDKKYMVFTEDNIPDDRKFITIHPLNLTNFDKYYETLIKNNHFLEYSIPKEDIKLLKLCKRPII